LKLLTLISSIKVWC